MSFVLLLSLFVWAAQAQSDEIPLVRDEHEALLNIFDSIGCNATYCPRWDRGLRCPMLPSRAHSEHIECINGSVTEIGLYNLDGAYLGGTLPTTLTRLSRLTTLYIFGFGGNDNGLQGTIPSELGLMRSLELVNLSGNRFSGSLPSELGRLAGLYEFRVHYNRLSGTIPMQLLSWSRIAHVHMHMNSLSGDAPKFNLTGSSPTCSIMAGGFDASPETNCILSCGTRSCCKVPTPASCPTPAPAPRPSTTTTTTRTTTTLTTTTPMTSTTTSTAISTTTTSTSDPTTASESTAIIITSTSPIGSSEVTKAENINSNSNSSGGDDDGNSNAALIGGVVGGAIVLIALLIAAVVLWRRRKQSTEQPTLMTSASTQRTVDQYDRAPCATQAIYGSAPVAATGVYDRAPLSSNHYVQANERLEF